MTRKYKYGKNKYAERVRGYAVGSYVRRISPKKRVLLANLRYQHRMFRKSNYSPAARGSFSMKQGGYLRPFKSKGAPRRIGRSFASSVNSLSFFKQRKPSGPALGAHRKSAVGNAVRAASHSGPAIVHSVSVPPSNPITVLPASRHARLLAIARRGSHRTVSYKRPQAKLNIAASHRRSKKLGAAIQRAAKRHASVVTSIAVQRPVTVVSASLPKRTSRPPVRYGR